jgi:SAM-dependent methyltransferase
LQQLFAEGGLDLKGEIFQAMQAAKPDEPFVILDGGCGSGTAIEEIVRTLPVEAARMGLHQKIEGVGVDENPIPHGMNPMVRWINPERTDGWSLMSNPWMGLQSPEDMQGLMALRATLKRADVCKMPLEDESINFGYYYATLIYVPDALKAIEEGYRVLKPGGVMIFNVEDRWISKTPRFDEILEQSPGASEAIQYQPSPTVPNDGFVVIRKPHNGTFEGFPYYLVDTVAPVDTAADRGEAPQERHDFNRAGIYKKYRHFLKVLD